MNPGPRIAAGHHGYADHATHGGARSYDHRDARINELHQGTSEIQRLVIALNETGLR